MIPPGATLGVVGGGQLGRMFALRARDMGYRIVVLDPDPRSPAAVTADHHIEAAYDDSTALEELAERCDAITTEFENVSAEALTMLARRRPVRPSGSAVRIVQDRIFEKTHLRGAGFATVPFVAVSTPADLAHAAGQIAMPGLLKTARLGYDGKGQAPVGDANSLSSAWHTLGGVPCVLEQRLDLELELSVILARGADGSTAAFPAGENRHRHGILDSTVVPARVDPRVAMEARNAAEAIAASLDYVGVLGVEFFVADGGRLFVNEVAPRPHNSGHYTMDACATDQFEQQVRALCDLPLGDARLLAPAAMVNLLGDLWQHGPPKWDRALAYPGVRLHLYGKTQPRKGRKMGHLNCVAADSAAALATAIAAREALTAS